MFDPKVCTAFYNSYLIYRTQYWNSAAGQAEAAIYGDIRWKKYQACVDINNKFYEEKVQTVDGVFPLLFQLGEEGRIKSELANANQMARTYIISEIMKNPEEKKRFEIKRVNLRKEANALEKKVRKLDDALTDLMAQRPKPSMNDITAAQNILSLEQQKFYQTLLKLGDLNDDLGIAQAFRLGLYKDLEFPNRQIEYYKELGKEPELFNELCEYIPFPYHTKYWEIQFQRLYRYQPHVNKPLDKYLESSATSSIINKPEEPSISLPSFLPSISNAVSSMFNRSQPTTPAASAIFTSSVKHT